MEYFEAIKFGIEQLLDWFKYNKNKKQEVFEAIEAIRKAANETSIYLQEHTERPLKPNKALSDLWMNTASKVRDKDIEVYQRLLSKADYWGNPNWDEERVKASKIQLKDIREAADSFLKKYKD